MSNRAGLAAADLETLEGEVADLATLADVFAWGRTRPDRVPADVIRDVVVQDEVTHDAIVPWGNGALVFAST